MSYRFCYDELRVYVVLFMNIIVFTFFFFFNRHLYWQPGTYKTCLYYIGGYFTAWVCVCCELYEHNY